MADSMDNDEPLHRLEALLDTVSQVGASAPGGNGLRAVRGAAGATRKWFGAAGVAGGTSRRWSVEQGHAAGACSSSRGTRDAAGAAGSEGGKPPRLLELRRQLVVEHCGA